MVSSRAKFRSSRAWKDFRRRMISSYPKCAFCGSQRATRTVHHVYECKSIEEYSDLSDDRFIVLCSQCHNYLHWLGRKKSREPAVVMMKEAALKAGFGKDWIKFY